MRLGGDTARQIGVEQRAVGAMYARLDAEVVGAISARERVLADPVEGAHELYARDVEVGRLTRRVAELRAAERSLCFGRIDHESGETIRIGRIGIRSESDALPLVDWRAEAARPFYAATPAVPLGLRRRRHLRLTGRTVVGVSDEILDGSAPRHGDVVGDGPLVTALSGARTGRMREAAATLQAEQDAIVRSPHRGVMVVDGGPGTGKTIVALHRAAYVLYAFPAIAERGVLVYGPNRRFLDYISDVLPSLGENDVTLATLADLAGTEGAATESDEAARIKGRAELATVLARWVRDRQPSRSAFDVKVGSETITVPAELVAEAHRHAISGGQAHSQAREVFKEFIASDVVTVLEERTTQALTATDDEVAALLGVDLDRAVAEDLRALGLDETILHTDPEIDWDAIREQLIEDPGLDTAIDAIWPRLHAEQALRDFLSDHTALATSLPEFASDELVSTLRPRRGAFTRSEVALLDEARALIDGPPEQTYGHIVVDEAQELSEMQWRMLMRRCPARSVTVVGDFAQAGSATTIRSWADAVGPFVGERFEHHRLTINYRTTAEILNATAPLLARIAPDQQLSTSIRHGDQPHTITVTDDERDDVLRELVTQAAADFPGELIGVIGAAESVATLGIVLGDTGAGIVAAPDARGLEFDSVLIVGPDAIEAARSGGARDLYVALSRATKRVWIVRCPTN
ncbi:HelD family protein [Microbacterium sp.]|uniref:HelD family protein n=1 Tax=Microbacterium sp. TaxID=51671 RepID=UPI0039E43F4A